MTEAIRALLAAGAVVAACAGEAPSPAVAPGSPAAEAPARLPLPASFAGVLPCADCEGIRWELDLRPDRVYFLRRVYLGVDRRGAFDEVGRWSLEGGREVLVLGNGGETPEAFSVESGDVLRKRDRAGREIDSAPPYELRRTEPYAPLQPRLRLRGMFTHLADAALFEECLTGLRLPVAMAEDYLALERAYLEAGGGGAPILAAVAGSIEPRPPMEGEAPVESLVVRRFEGLSPGETCGDRAGRSDLP